MNDLLIPILSVLLPLAAVIGLVVLAFRGIAGLFRVVDDVARAEQRSIEGNAPSVAQDYHYGQEPARKTEQAYDPRENSAKMRAAQVEAARKAEAAARREQLERQREQDVSAWIERVTK